MSRTLATNSGSLDSFHESCLCGANPKTCHTRETIDCDRPKCSAIDRVDQCVAPGGVVSNVAVINASIYSSPTTRGRPGRGSSSSPSHRLAANRLRQLEIVFRSNSSRSATSTLLPPSAHASTIRARRANPAALLLRLGDFRRGLFTRQADTSRAR
jgi:hypothetical protein